MSDLITPIKIFNEDINFTYAGGSMGWGYGHFWHKLFNLKFPNFPIITKTVTLRSKRGYPYAIILTGKSIFNHVAHDNKGFYHFMKNYYNKDLIISLAGTDEEIEYMVNYLDDFELRGIQLSYSCPNVKNPNNKKIPKSRHDLYLKLNYLQDPYQYDLSDIKGITVNSVPCWFGGGSGKYAQQYNWPFIKKFNQEGLNIHGCSFINKNDIKFLVEYCGCKNIDIGSVMLINPKLILNLNK